MVKAAAVFAFLSVSFSLVYGQATKPASGDAEAVKQLSGRVVLNVCRDHDRPYFFQRIDTMLLAPGEELHHGLGVGRARIPVPDRCREEFNEAPGRCFARAPDRRGQRFKPGAGEIPRGDGDEFPAHRRGSYFLRMPNSSGSIKSAGSISSSAKRSAAGSFSAQNERYRLCQPPPSACPS